MDQPTSLNGIETVCTGIGSALYDSPLQWVIMLAPLAFVLVLSFLLFPLADRFRNRIQIWDVIPCILAVGIMAYALIEGDDFTIADIALYAYTHVAAGGGAGGGGTGGAGGQRGGTLTLLLSQPRRRERPFA